MIIQNRRERSERRVLYYEILTATNVVECAMRDGSFHFRCCQKCEMTNLCSRPNLCSQEKFVKTQRYASYRSIDGSFYFYNTYYFAKFGKVARHSFLSRTFRLKIKTKVEMKQNEVPEKNEKYLLIN